MFYLKLNTAKQVIHYGVLKQKYVARPDMLIIVTALANPLLVQEALLLLILAFLNKKISY